MQQDLQLLIPIFPLDQRWEQTRLLVQVLGCCWHHFQIENWGLLLNLLSIDRSPPASIPDSFFFVYAESVVVGGWSIDVKLVVCILAGG